MTCNAPSWAFVPRSLEQNAEMFPGQLRLQQAAAHRPSHLSLQSRFRLLAMQLRMASPARPTEPGSEPGYPAVHGPRWGKIPRFPKIGHDGHGT